MPALQPAPTPPQGERRDRAPHGSCPERSRWSRRLDAAGSFLLATAATSYARSLIGNVARDADVTAPPVANRSL
jgi:hypothetical protein